MSGGRATAIGFTAIIMWGFLALFSKLAGDVPPFQLLAVSFFIGGLVGIASWAFRPQAWRILFGQPLQLWLLNIGGLFLCHFLYFSAVRRAPVIEVSLISYLWPLLIVVFSAAVAREKLKLHHMIGVGLGIVGALLVITKGESLSLSQGIMSGHLIAIPYAFLWAGFSVAIRRFGNIPSDIVTGFCFGCAALAAITHFMIEPTLWHLSLVQWLAIVSLGLFPMGAAFYAWDYGMKHGDRIILGAASYAAPVISSVVLLAVGFASYHWSIVAACLAITLGAVLASKDLLYAKSAAESGRAG